MIRKVEGQQSSDTLSPAATRSGISQALSPSWNTVSKDEFARRGNSLLDAGKALAAGSRETTAAETVSSSLTQGGRRSSLRASKMNSSPSEGVIEVSPLEAASARPSPQTLVSDSRQFSFGEKTRTGKRLLLQRRWRRKRKLPGFGPCHVNRWVVLLLYCLYCVFAGPAYINWTPLADILFRAGAFAWMCDDSSSNPAAPPAYSPLGAAPPPPAADGERAAATAAASDGAGFAAVNPSAGPAAAGLPGPATAAVLAAGNSAAVDSSTGHSVASRCSTAASVRQTAGRQSVSGECETAAAAAATTKSSSSSSRSESMVRCTDQEAEVNRLFTITAASHFFFSFIGGMLLDSAGPKITAVIGLSLGMIGWILLGAANKDIHSYVAGCLFLGAGVDTTYFPLLSGANLFPGHVSTVKSLFGAAASFSFAVPLVLRAVYFTTNAQIKHSTLFFGYASVCMGAALLIAIFVVPWKPWKSPYRSLLSGERQRSHPLAAACGLATQSSQLPVAASNRAFDIIAVNYSSSSPSSPASLSALPEEPAAPCSRDSCRDSSRDSSGDSSPPSNSPAAPRLPHNHGDRNNFTAVRTPHTLAAAGGQCNSPSKPNSESPALPPLLLSPTSRRSDSSNSSSNSRSRSAKLRAAARPAQQLSNNGHKTPSKSAAADGRLLQREGSSSNRQDDPPGVSAAGASSGPCASSSSSWQHSDAQQQYSHSPPFPLDTATSWTPPWQPQRDEDRENISASARAAAAARTAAVRLCAASETASASDTCAASKSHSGTSAAPVDTCSTSRGSAASAAAAATETPPAAAAPSLLLEDTTADSAASPPHKRRTGEGRLAKTRGKKLHRPSPENKFATSDFSSSTAPPPVSLPFGELPSAAAAPPRHTYVHGCSDDSLPTWNRDRLQASSFVVFPSSSSSSSSSSFSFKLTSSPPHTASSVSRLSSSHPPHTVSPLPSDVSTAADALQALAAGAAPAADVSASCCVGQGSTAPITEASLPRQPVFFNAVPVPRSTSVACSSSNSPEEAEEDMRGCGEAQELAVKVPPRYATVSAVHAAAAAVPGEDPTVAAAAERALEPPSLREEIHSQPVNASSSSVRAAEASHMHTAAVVDECGSAVAAFASAERHAAAQSHRLASDKTTHPCERATAAAAAVAACEGGCSSDMLAGHPIVKAASPAAAGASKLLPEGDAGPTSATQQASTNTASIPTARRGFAAAAAADTISPLPALPQQTPACRAAHVGPMSTSASAAAGATAAAARETAAAAGGTAGARYDPRRAAAPPPPASLSSVRGSSKRRIFWSLRSSFGRHNSRLQARTVHGGRCREQLLSIRRDFLSSLFLPIVPFFCIILTGVVFFIPSARHLLPSAYAANRIIQIFSFLPCPLFGHIADVCGIMPVMYICNGCGLLSFVFVMIPQIPAAVPLQYMASLLSASQLSFLVCQICCYVAETFDDENQGKLIGTLCCIAGLTSLSAHYVMDYAVRHGFFKPLILFIIALSSNFLLLAFVHWRKQRLRRMRVSGRGVFRSSREPPDAAAAALSAHRHKRLFLPLFAEMSAAAEAPSPPSPPLVAPSDSPVQKTGSGANAAATTAAAAAAAAGSAAASSSESSRPPTFVAASAHTIAETEANAAAGGGGAGAPGATAAAALEQQQQQQRWAREEAPRGRAERRKERE